MRKDSLAYWLRGEGILEGNYQLDQSILAIGSGGLLGRGLGESRQKWFFLPDAHTDFIFSIVGEELGLLGAVVLIGLLSVLLWRAYDSARRAPDRFGSLLAVGIGASVAVYAGVNLLVATGEAGAVELARAARDAGLGRDAVHQVADAEAAAQLLKTVLQPDDVVLIKGSRGVGLDRTVDALLGWEAA